MLPANGSAACSATSAGRWRARECKPDAGQRLTLEAHDDLVELRIGLEVEALRRTDEAGLPRQDFDRLAADLEARRPAHRQADQAVAAEPVRVHAHVCAPGQAIQRQRPCRQVVHARAQRLPGPYQMQLVRIEDPAADCPSLVQIGRVEKAAAREVHAGEAAGQRGCRAQGVHGRAPCLSLPARSRPATRALRETAGRLREADCRPAAAAR